MLWLVVSVWAGCGPQTIDAGDGGVAATSETTGAHARVVSAPEIVVDAALVDRYPSLAYYPEEATRLHGALQAAAGPREILAALAEGVAAHRWPGMIDWDRHGFIAVDGAVRGHVTRVSGALIQQPSDRHDLGCAGGFLEGVRLTLLPRLAIEELDRCLDAPDRVQGGPGRCDPEHDYGWLALTNVAVRLEDRQLPAGRRLLEFDVHDSRSLDALGSPGAMHLCTVSHVSATYGHARFFHHMMIVLGTDDGAAFDVFDTTGGRGVSLVSMSRPRFVRYCTAHLRNNREFRYEGRATGLTCLAVAAL